VWRVQCSTTTGCSGARATGVFGRSEGRRAGPLNQVLGRWPGAGGIVRLTAWRNTQ
jgi:hypothetical protein